ncbi:MAG: hypothetical protein KAS32_02935, partial [Candidatus Peribacteraceae bacterium]|nr:hypothetical protein [Candidatus Peribacteraceae bacterium]
TPDRDGCGVILNMVPTVDIEENGDFGDQSKEVVTSYPISLSPFLEHNDQVRLQMVSNNLKQSILLKESENPLIRSGVEDAYLEESTFMYKAKDNGKVEYLDSKFMIVSYENGETDIIRISFRNLYLNSIDYLVPDFREGDEFKRGDIMCHSIMTKNGELALGQNLHTGIAIWKGYNYEDGIVIRESATKKFVSMHSVDLTYAIEPGQVLLSLLDDKYSPFPKIGQDLKKGDVYAKIKTLDGEDGFESINIEPFEFAAPCNCRITDIEIYPNSWNKKVDEFNKAVHTLTTKQTDNFVSLQQRLSSFMPQDDVEKFITLHGLSRLDCSSRKGKYTYKGQKIGGIIIKIQAVYEEQIGIGDKMANRHGNKGVIAKVVPDDIMPTTADGRKLDIIINPLGIISRMNVGQLYELHTNEAMYRLKAKLRALKTDKKKLAVLKGFLDIVDKSSTKWVTDKIMDVYEKALKDDPESAEDKLYLIQPPFESIKAGSLFEAMEYAGATFKSKVTDNSNNLELENPIATGYVHFLKLVHRSSDKMSARSIGPYSKKTLQPLGGKSKQGGHRLGEMETWALQAHGAQNLLEDFLTVQSDSSGLKNQFLAEVLHNPDLNVTKTDPRPQSLKLLDSYLMVMGLGIDNKGNIIEAVEAEELEDSLPDIVLGGDSEEEVADE